MGRHGGAGVDSYTDNDDMSFHHCDFIGNIAHIEGGGLFIGMPLNEIIFLLFLPTGSLCTFCARNFQ